MVGGLLISGLALGAGTASGAVGDKCKVGSDWYESKSATYSPDASNNCVDTSGVKVVATLLSTLTADLVPTSAPVIPTSEAASPAAGGSTPSDGAPAKTSGSASPTPSATVKTSTPKATVPAPAPGPLVAAPAPAPVAAPAALGAAGPVGALPPLAGMAAPAGLASSLFSANAYDPGLLFSTPLGNAASALFAPKADTDVTTVSQAEVLPTTAGDGYGTPVTIGVIILACLIGFAVRHRVISRMKNREVPAAEYQPRHAAPDAEPEPETELQDVSDEARTLVVLTRK